MLMATREHELSMSSLGEIAMSSLGEIAMSSLGEIAKHSSACELRRNRLAT